jgi:hypothetical protein
LRLIAKLHALSSSRLLVAGLLAVLLGGLLAILAAPLWLAAAGVFLASAGVATLIAAAGYRRASDDPDLRLALAGVLFVPALFVGGFLWFHGSTVEATAKGIVPIPGAPLRLSEAGSEVGSDGPGRSLLEGTFTVMQIAESGASVATEANMPSRVFRIQLPVRPSDCSRLGARFGGGCSRPGPALRGFATFDILSLRRALPLTAEIRPFGASALELIETTSQAQQSIPTEWNLTSYGSRTDVALHCVDGTPLELKTSFAAGARGRCTPGGSTYELTVQTAGERPAMLFLNELSEFTAHVSGRTAHATVADAELSVDGEEKALPSRLTPIYMHADQDHMVELAIEQSLGSDLNHVSLSSTGVSTVEANRRELIPNWIERHSDFVYFVLGILIASLAPTLFDFTLSRFKR